MESVNFVDVTEESLDEKRLVFHQWTFISENYENEAVSTQSKEHNIHFHSIKFGENSVFVWIGDKDAKLDNLSCGMQTNFANEPLAIYLLFGNSDQDSSSLSSNDLARKLSKRLKKQVFVSLNVSPNTIDNFEAERSYLNSLEMALFREIKQNPNKF